jgi:hypothetical protein
MSTPTSQSSPIQDVQRTNQNFLERLKENWLSTSADILGVATAAVAAVLYLLNKIGLSAFLLVLATLFLLLLLFAKMWFARTLEKVVQASEAKNLELSDGLQILSAKLLEMPHASSASAAEPYGAIVSELKEYKGAATAEWAKIAKQIEALSVGIKIRYVERDDRKERVGRKYIFEEAKNVVTRAEESIFVVNSFVFETTPKISPGARHVVDSYEEEYYDALLAHVIRKDLRYERILQLREGQKVQDLVDFPIDDGLAKHLHEMLTEKERRKNDKISLKKVPANRFTTFVLVDKTHLIWQINELVRMKSTDSGEVIEKLQMQGIFIIEDPRMEITQHFKKFFIRLRNDPFEKAVELRELPQRINT